MNDPPSITSDPPPPGCTKPPAVSMAGALWMARAREALSAAAAARPFKFDARVQTAGSLTVRPARMRRYARPAVVLMADSSYL
jgi:hypothetical protein